MTIGQQLFLGVIFNHLASVMEHPPAGLATGGRLGVACLGSVLMVTIMVGAEKIYLSLGRASQH